MVPLEDACTAVEDSGSPVMELRPEPVGSGLWKSAADLGKPYGLALLDWRDCPPAPSVV